MIKLIVGNKGSGKTKRLIDMVNDAVKTSKGNVVCVEKGNTLKFDVSHQARLIDIEDYAVSGFEMFYGFFSGRSQAITILPRCSSTPRSKSAARISRRLPL